MRRLAVLLAVLAFPACGGSMPPTPGTTPASPASGGGNAWTALAPLLEARQEIGLAELQGRIYAARRLSAGPQQREHSKGSVSRSSK